ncbi:putative ribosome-assembly protein 3 [Lyophyllum shimeji]|uniref:Ribosome assembly protein 3 n=1 Tax=Lyophyllum shimeji TaxID=47721 RepID=A0A9P3UH48_LYOSH|nr:putative ribosome-assembly protein 3 [Lyophyllum shimeji]
MPPAAARPAQRKRTRKRKRRVASESSSSSSSGSDSETGEPSRPSKPTAPPISQPEASSSSSETSSDSSSDSEIEPEPTIPAGPTPIARQPNAVTKARPVGRTSPSPSPPPGEIPSFIHTTDPAEKESQEQLMKAKFRKFWMASVADGFKDDLEEIRKEPNLGTSRLSLLIDSLASGADVFTTSSRPNKSNSINEIEVIHQ